MGTAILVIVVVLVIAALVFGVVTLLSGDDPALVGVEADGRARPLPNTRSLSEFDLKGVRFDLALRGYRMAQVDRVLRRTAYDVGYKDEMIAVLEAEVVALREGRTEDADLLRKARESAASTTVAGVETPSDPAYQHPNTDFGDLDRADAVDGDAAVADGPAVSDGDATAGGAPVADAVMPSEEAVPGPAAEGEAVARHAAVVEPDSDSDSDADSDAAGPNETAMDDAAPGAAGPGHAAAPADPGVDDTNGERPARD